MSVGDIYSYVSVVDSAHFMHEWLLCISGQVEGTPWKIQKILLVTCIYHFFTSIKEDGRPAQIKVYHRKQAHYYLTFPCDWHRFCPQ